jgi:fermentation-respiration switch protein FrsA (DUF1100 family)
MGNKESRPDSHPVVTSSRVQASQRQADTANATPEELSYFQMAKLGYEQLVGAIIRPPRCQYTVRHLGPIEFTFCGRQIKRKDFELHNMRGQLLACSMWEPTERGDDQIPCVIYMHGNSSARVEALPQLSLALSLGCNFVAFDFAGSGLSEGEYVSLGFFERDDLQVVIEYLRGTGTTSSIALWGRSMGAATALMHGERDPCIGGMILDSSFADLTLLAESMVEKGKEHGYSVPAFVVKLAIRFIRSSVQKTAGFDIKALTPIKHVDSCFIPALFVAGGQDNFVPPGHSQMLHDAYAGEKSISIVEGDHNTPRPADFFHVAALFLISALHIPEDWVSQEGLAWAGSGMGPWTLSKRIGRVESMGGKVSAAGSSSAASSSAPSSSSSSAAASENRESMGDYTFDQILAMSMMVSDAFLFLSYLSFLILMY